MQEATTMFLRFALVLCAALILDADARAQVPAAMRTDALGDPLPAGAIARLGTLRLKHLLSAAGANTAIDKFVHADTFAIVSKVFFSPDGKTLASMASDGFQLWDAKTGKEIPGLQWLFFGQPHGAAFSSDGKLVAVSASEFVMDKSTFSQIKIWDVPGAKLIHDLKVPSSERASALAFTGDGKTLVTAGVGVVHWLDVASGKETRSWKPFDDEKLPIKGGKAMKLFVNCALSPGAKYLALNSAFRYFPDDPNQEFVASPPEEAVAMGFDLATGNPCWRTPLQQSDLQRQFFTFSGDEKWFAHKVASDKV